MALKRISHLLFVLLWLSILLLFLYEYYNVKPRSISYYSSSVSRQPPISRKVLSSKFDFTPFQKQRHRHRHHHSHRHGRSPNMQVQPEPAGTEIDPRYGVEKRLVPTGPNPLHH